MRNIYTSIDIGSDSVKAVVLELNKNKLNLLAASSVKSEGIRKGLIIDYEKATKAVLEVVNNLKETLGIEITKVLASVPSYNVDFTFGRSEINIENEEKMINSSDIVSVLQKSVKNNMSKTRELITILPIDFSSNKFDRIVNPIGKIADNLSSRNIIVSSPRKNISSVVGLLENANLEVIDIDIPGVSNYYSLSKTEDANKIGAIIDIGAEKTEVSLYNKGIIIKNSVIPFGGKNIDNDIAYIYNTSLDSARKIKEKIGLGHKIKASLSDYYDIKTKEGELIKVNQFEISEVIMSRLGEILTLAKKEILNLTNKNMDYIIITGGVSHTPDLKYLADEIFAKIASIGELRIIGARNNKYSVAIGTVTFFINKLRLKEKSYTMIDRESQEELSNSKKKLLNVSSESMIGKIFGFFTNE